MAERVKSNLVIGQLDNLSYVYVINSEANVCLGLLMDCGEAIAIIVHIWHSASGVD